MPLIPSLVARLQPQLLKQVKADNKIKFDADKVNGQFTVMRIEKTK